MRSFYKYFPDARNVWATSTMFPVEKPFTREETSGASLASLSGQRNFTKAQPRDKMTKTARECFECMKAGNLTRVAVNAAMSHRTLQAINTGISTLIKLGLIRSERVGSNGSRYMILREEVA